MKLTCYSEFWSRGKGESFDICPCDWKGDNCCPVEKSTANCPEQTSTARNISTQRCQLILLQPTVRHHRVYHNLSDGASSPSVPTRAYQDVSFYLQTSSTVTVLLNATIRRVLIAWFGRQPDSPKCSADGGMSRVECSYLNKLVLKLLEPSRSCVEVTRERSPTEPTPKGSHFVKILLSFMISNPI
jgi:hypothetical protein